MKRKMLSLFMVLCTILTLVPCANAAKNKGYIFPVPNYSGINQYYSSSHAGIDIGASKDTKIYASKSGTVVKKYKGCNNYNRSNGVCKTGGACSPNHGYSKGSNTSGYCNDGFGNGYIIKHDDGTWAEYAHLNSLSSSVLEGEYVSQGTYLGGVGSSGNSTGPHLHFGLRTGNVSSFWSATPMNPFDYMDTNDVADIPSSVPNGLALGDRGDDVKKLQSTLNGMTGTSLGLDGYYGPNTEKAVKAYQKKKGLTVDGWYGNSTKAVLEDDVKKLQSTLNGMTGTSLNADGYYGPNTKKAVEAYQKKKGLTVDGWYGASTKTTLEGEVKNLQKMLNATSGTALNADGYYGPNTKKAVEAYQKKQGLTVDGWYGASTKAVLESDYKNLTSSSQSNPTSVSPSTPEPTQTQTPEPTPKTTDDLTSTIEPDPTPDTDRDYPSTSVLKVFSGSTLQIAVDDTLVNFADAQPLIDSNGRTQVPIRAVSEMLDCDVEWISETHTAIITRENSDTIIIVIGSDTMLVNNNKVKMDTAALIKNDRTYIPVRFVAEALGLTVEWE